MSGSFADGRWLFCTILTQIIDHYNNTQLLHGASSIVSVQIFDGKKCTTSVCHGATWWPTLSHAFLVSYMDLSERDPQKDRNKRVFLINKLCRFLNVMCTENIKQIWCLDVKRLKPISIAIPVTYYYQPVPPKRLTHSNWIICFIVTDI